MAKTDGSTFSAKLSAFIAAAAALLMAIGVIGILLVIAAYMVFPALCGMSGIVEALWGKGALGKSCVFGTILLAGYLGFQFSEWFRRRDDLRDGDTRGD